MTAPALAKNDAEGRRFYTFGDPPESFWSVTTLIGGGTPKYALPPHYAKMAAELAVDAMLERGPHSRSSAIVRRLAAAARAEIAARQAIGELTSLTPAKLRKMSQRDFAVRWVKGAADRHRDTAAARGIAVHGEAEALVLQQARESSRLILAHDELEPWPAELEGYQRSFVRWLEDFEPEFIAAEASVFNRRQAYAGTLDAIARVWLGDHAEPLVAVIDYKSGAAVYAEVAMQLAAYARGEFIGAPDRVTELPMPAVQAGAVLHLKGDGTYQFRLVRIDEPIFDAFKYAREVWRFVNETSRTVLLQDLTKVREEAT